MDRGGIRTIAWFVTAALLLGACGTGDEEPTTPTAPIPTATTSEPAPTETIAEPVTPAPTETQPADPFAIPADPADIDKDYVELVLEELNLSLVEATRIVANREAVPPSVRRVLDATHFPAARDGYVRTFRELLNSKRPSIKFSRNPDPVDIVSVDEIFTASDTCMFVLVTQDSSGLVQGNSRPFANYYHLRVKRPPAARRGNPTPWKVVLDSEPPRGGKEYADPCE